MATLEVSAYDAPHGRLPGAAFPQPERAGWRGDEEANEGSPIGRYLDVLRRRWRLIAGFALAAALLMGVYCLFAERRYSATAVLHVKTQAPNVTSIQQVVVPPTPFESIEYFQDQIKFLESKTLAAAVVKELHLEDDPVFARDESGILDDTLGALTSAYEKVAVGLGLKEAPLAADADTSGSERVYDVPTSLISRYKRALEITPVMNSRMVEVSFTSPSASLSQRVANAHVRGFIHQGLQSKFELTGEARKFLETEIDRVQTHLAKAEQALNEFRRQHHVMSLDDRENAIVDRLSDLSRRLTEAEATRIGAEADFKLLEGREYDSLPTVISNGLIQSLKQEVGRLEIRQAEVGAVFLGGSPQMQEVNSQLTSARARLKRELERVAAAVESAYMGAVAREQGLRRQFEAQQSSVLNLKEISGQYIKLEQDVIASRNLYGTLLTRMQETDVVKGVQLASASVMDPADRPRGASSPAVAFNLAFALILGLGLGTVLAVVLESVDGSLKTPEDVRTHLRLPTLGVVPDLSRLPGVGVARRTLPALGRHANLPVPVPSDRAVRIEAFRSIRTSLLFFNPDRPPRTILVTSSQPGEGKTSTTVHLALSLAQLATNVVVVDADMRQPRCHRALGVEPSTGLAEVLRGLVPLSEAIRHHTVVNGRVLQGDGVGRGPRLALLQAGHPPSDPSALLGSPRMLEVLAHLTATYELVLIDSPPVFPITDSAILAPRVDSVVLVVRGHSTDRHVTREALERLRLMQARVMGVVLNGVDPTSSHYRSYSSYYFAA
jgi:succinoglycan biosynthesis transport protein ExoP